MNEKMILPLEWGEVIENISWHEAVKYSDSLTDGWRLPKIEELSIAYNLVVNGFCFHNSYWSETEYLDKYAFTFNFSRGHHDDRDKDCLLSVRFVRKIEGLESIKEIFTDLVDELEFHIGSSECNCEDKSTKKLIDKANKIYSNIY